MKNTLIVITTAALLCGCVSYGRKIDQSKVQQIKPGQTTSKQIIGLIGSPDQVTTTGTSTIFHYVFVRATPKATTYIPVVGAFAGGANVQNESVIIQMTNNVVSSVTSSYGGNDLGTGANAGSSADLPATTEDKRPK